MGASLAFDSSNAIRDDAVATGTTGAPLRFTAPAGLKLTVYVDAPGPGEPDEVAARLRCAVRGDGLDEAFSGARQRVSTTIGVLASVGSFTSSGGAMRLQCAGSPEALVVTPASGMSVFGGVLLLIAGVLLAGLGVALFVIGARRDQQGGRPWPPRAGRRR